MSNLRQAAQQALEALEWSKPHADASITYEEAITALRAALAEPEQEPVAWMTHSNDLLPLFHRTEHAALMWGAEPTPLYTALPQRKPLTDEELKVLAMDSDGTPKSHLEFARDIEWAHGIKGDA